MVVYNMICTPTDQKAACSNPTGRTNTELEDIYLRNIGPMSIFEVGLSRMKYRHIFPESSLLIARWFCFY